MGMPVGTEYRRARWVTVYFTVVAVLWGGFGIYSLARHGMTSGWFFIAAAFFGYAAVQARRLPYAVANAVSLTVWVSPFRSQTVTWRDMVAARRVGPSVRIERQGGKPLNLRCDSVVPETRERFVSEFAARLDNRWTDDSSATLAESRRLWASVAVLAVVLIAVLWYLTSTGLIRIPVGLP